MLCKKYRLLPPRPAPSYKLALIFPVESNSPKLEYINCPVVIDDEVKECEKPDIVSLLGNDSPRLGMAALGPYPLHDNRGHTLCVYFRDAFLLDGSKQNESIIAATRGAVSRTWCGPCVFMRSPWADFYSDVTLLDLRSAVEYFSAP